MNVFVAGESTWVFRFLGDKEFTTRPATICGYTKQTIQLGGNQRVVVPSADDTLEGKLYEITEDELAKLDRFILRGDSYARQTTTTLDGESADVYVYTK